MNTYEQALQYLGGDASVSDESIQALYTVKVYPITSVGLFLSYMNNRSPTTLRVRIKRLKRLG